VVEGTVYVTGLEDVDAGGTLGRTPVEPLAESQPLKNASAKAKASDALIMELECTKTHTLYK
jgi:hypothetical protein